MLAVLASGCGITDSEDDPVTTDPNPGPFRVDQSPAWSPGGDRIAYFHDAGETEDTTDVSGLYVRNLETDSTWLVVEGPARSPDWRPDGERIAFSTGDIFTIRPNGSDPQRVTDHGSAFFPSWAPGGDRLAYDATSLPKKGIWLVDPDGTNRKHLGLGRDPDWNVAGSRLVYEGPPGSANSNPQLWAADTSRIDSTRLTDNDFVDNRHPSWSPNGEWIVWVAFDGPSDPFCQLRVMESDGSETRTIAECDVTPSVSWASDADHLVFVRRAQENEDYTALWVVRRDGSGLRQLTNPSRNPLN